MTNAARIGALLCLSLNACVGPVLQTQKSAVREPVPSAERRGLRFTSECLGNGLARVLPTGRSLVDVLPGHAVLTLAVDVPRRVEESISVGIAAMGDEVHLVELRDNTLIARSPRDALSEEMHIEYAVAFGDLGTEPAGSRDWLHRFRRKASRCSFDLEPILHQAEAGVPR